MSNGGGKCADIRQVEQLSPEGSGVERGGGESIAHGNENGKKHSVAN